MRYWLFKFGFAFISASSYPQVGIQTQNVHPSALLEVDTSILAIGGKKGFLGPRVNLTGNLDTVTIPSPATGLLVYNTADAGTFPTNVLANRYYFWNGTQWIDMGQTNLLQNYIADRLLSANSTASQTFTFNEINNTSGSNGGLVVSFADSDIVVNSGSVATKSGNNFTVNITGLYEISAYVNYNPNRTTVGTPQRGSFLNLKLQRYPKNGSAWVDIIGNRTSWGIKTNNLLKTALLVSTPIYLNSGDMLRLVVQNPFAASDTSALHAETDGNSSITSSSKVPISKSFTLILLDYDLQ